jgi:hypothetical protein
MTGDADQLREYLALDEDDLLVLLGGELLGSGPGFGPSDDEHRSDFARRWLESTLDDVRERLCGDIWESIRGGLGTAMENAATIADALAAMLGRATANVVAVILLRRGLDRLCEVR